MSQVNSKLQKVPKGYKQTEVGVIPDNWDVVSIGEISEVKTGPFGSTLHEKDYVIDGTPIITVEHLGELGVTYKNLPMVSDVDRKRLNAYALRKGDIAFSRVGSIDRNALIGEKEDGWLFSGRLLRVRLKGYKNIPEYLSYHFHSSPFKKRVVEVAVGQTMPSLNTAILKGIKVVFPPTKKEQNAIANALSDVDALITSLEKLIAKKSDIKTAVMQQLLTGRKRLPPFDKLKIGYKKTELGEIPCDWKIVPLSDFVGALEAGISVNSVEDKEAFGHGKAILKTSCVLGGYFYPDEAKGIIPKDLSRAKMNPQKGNIIISRMNTPDLVGEIGFIDNDYENLFLPDRLWQTKYKTGANVCGRWLAFILSYPDAAKQIKDSATGTSNSMKNISKGSLLSTLIVSPPREEQSAIASVLSDMDKEIDMLEQRLNKTQQIKQGMMQELLTGRTRLV